MPVVYNAQAKRFERDGEAITAAALTALIATLTAKVKRQARALSRRLDNGTMSLEQWQQGMAQLLTSAHIIAASVGRGGFARMTEKDWNRVNKKIAWQQGYLALFAKSIAAGVVVLGTGAIVARAAKYADSPYISFTSAYKEAMTDGGKQMMCRLITNSIEGCEECAEDEAAGWMPVDDMGEIGSRICGDFCKCVIEFEDEI